MLPYYAGYEKIEDMLAGIVAGTKVYLFGEYDTVPKQDGAVIIRRRAVAQVIESAEVLRYHTFSVTETKRVITETGALQINQMEESLAEHKFSSALRVMKDWLGDEGYLVESALIATPQLYVLNFGMPPNWLHYDKETNRFEYREPGTVMLFPGSHGKDVN